MLLLIEDCCYTVQPLRNNPPPFPRDLARVAIFCCSEMWGEGVVQSFLHIAFIHFSNHTCTTATAFGNFPTCSKPATGGCAVLQIFLNLNEVEIKCKQTQLFRFYLEGNTVIIILPCFSVLSSQTRFFFSGISIRS